MAVSLVSVKGLKQKRDLGMLQVWERVHIVAVTILGTEK